MSNETISSPSLQSEVNRLRNELEVLKNQGYGAPPEDIMVGNYLLARLSQLGVTSMFGVPGDFNLGFLDLVEDHETIQWVGSCNEMGGAYAADGYARVKENGVGVVLTTFGVGELSAMNGVAGAFSERVPVVHIVGVPNTTQQKTKPLLHHTLGDGRFDAYLKASQQITISQASLLDKETAASEIDRVLTDCITKAHPVYITLPTDLVFFKIPSTRLSTPLSPASPPNDPDVESFVLDEITKLVESAQGDVVVLVDACAIRHNVRAEVAELLKKTGFPVYAAPMGKTAINENHERYGGIYIGSISHPAIKEKVESATLILSIGSLKSDFNTGNFTYKIPLSRTIELHSDHTQVQYAGFPGIGMKHLLPKLTERLHSFASGARKLEVPKFALPVPQEDNDTITHTWLWARVGEFLKPKDVVVAETGTSAFGILDVPFPDGAVFVSQILWGSIGWTVGSTVGAALAAQELGLNRTILFIGDGSFQIMIQELSTMIHYGLKPIIFVLNNSGYTVERFLHGRDRHYNDIANWKWTSLLDTFSDRKHPHKSYGPIGSKEELSTLLDDVEFAKADKIQLVELLMDKFDAPKLLQEQATLSGKTNAYGQL